MTQEEKDLLFKDLSARLYYGVKIDCRVHYFGYDIERAEIIGLNRNLIAEVKCKSYESYNVSLEDYYTKIYLRPMSSMTEEERKEYLHECDKDDKDALTTPRYHGTDWLNSHHFDYRGLIEKGLALEAPEGMYKTE